MIACKFSCTSFLTSLIYLLTDHNSIRPCNHQFCNVCIKQLEREGEQDASLAQRGNWKCPTCDANVARVAGFSAPMNLPGEEPMRIKVPVNVLKINDGRVRLSSIQKTRI